jgi:antitoxin ChpS
MHTTNLRKVGGSVMLAVPRAILDLLHLEAGATVGLAVEGERLILSRGFRVFQWNQPLESLTAGK